MKTIIVVTRFEDNTHLITSNDKEYNNHPWTQEKKVEKVMEIDTEYDIDSIKLLNKVNEIVIEYAYEYGIEYTRGGSFISPSLSNRDKRILYNTTEKYSRLKAAEALCDLRNSYNKYCYICGSFGHWHTECLTSRVYNYI